MPLALSRGRRPASKGRRWVAALLLLLAPLGCRKQAPALRERAEVSAQKAVDYFARRPESVARATLFAVDYVRRKFAVAKLDPVVAQWNQGNVDRGEEIMRALGRWLDPAAPFVPHGRGLFRHPYEKAVYEGLHCASQPGWSAAAFERDLRALISERGYGATHAAIGARLAKENGCLGAELLAALEALIVPELLRTAGAERQNLDLFFEAVALLHYLGARDRVRPEWVERVLAAQHADGGWGMEVGDATSRDHSSALALWVVMEAARPEARPVEWIPQRR